MAELKFRQQYTFHHHNEFVEFYLNSYCSVNKNQKSTDVHKEDSVDEDNQDDAIGDNSNSMRIVK